VSRPVVLYGAGGHGREITALIGRLCAEGADWELKGWLSDEAASWGRTIAGLPVLGDGEWLRGHPGMAVVVAIGAPRTRQTLVRRIEGFNPSFPALIDPRALTMPRSVVGQGSVVMAGAILSVDTTVGEFCSVNLRCTINHDCRLGDYATLGPGTALTGDVTLDEGVEIGAGGTCIPGVSVGAWSMIGAGAVVISNLPANCTAVGVPARIVSPSFESGPVRGDA
jgi:sugar O-acyltransferase (sialic acid O-acetyltransferase NeuD family)